MAIAGDFVPKLHILRKWFASDSEVMWRNCFCVFLVILLVTAAAMLIIGPIVIRHFAVADIVILLDGGWRVFQGQKPHVDFYTPLGLLTLLLIATGMKVAGPSAEALVYAKVLGFAITSLWAWWVARYRFGPIICMIFALCIGFIIASGYAWCTNRYELSYGGFYNRIGVAIVSIIAVESLCPWRGASKSVFQCSSGVLTGVGLAALLCTKPNFFVIAALFVTAGIFLFPQVFYRWIGIGIGGLVFGIMVLAYLNFDYASILHDLWLSGKIRAGFWRKNLGDLILDQEMINWVLLLACICWITPTSITFKEAVNPKVGKLYLGAIWLLSQLLTYFGTFAQFYPILLPAFVLIFAEMTRRCIGAPVRLNENNKSGHLMRVWEVNLYLCCIAVLYVLLSDMKSIPYSAYVKYFKINQVAKKFSSDALKDLLVLDENDYVVYVNDGLELLRPYLKPADRVTTLDFSNPFSFAFQQQPPRGDALWWHEGVTYDTNTYLAPEKVFTDASLVMVPRKESAFVQKFLSVTYHLRDIYMPFVISHFEKVAESQHWCLFRRKNTVQGLRAGDCDPKSGWKVAERKAYHPHFNQLLAQLEKTS